MSLTQEYLEKHQGNVMTYEAFGRALAANILEAAKQQAAKLDKPADTISVDTKVTVIKVKELVCVDIQVCTPFGCVSVHVP